MGGLACYDLEGAKALRSFEVTCQAYSAKLTLNEALVSELESQKNALLRIASSADRQILECKDLQTKADVVIDSLNRALSAERTWSLREDAFWPSVAVVAAVTVAAGAGGFFLAQSLH